MYQEPDPGYSLGDYVERLVSTHHRGPLGRVLSWLRSCRSSDLQRSANRGDPGSLAQAREAEQRAGFGRGGLVAPLLPSHLPPRPAAFHRRAPDAVESGRRRERRYKRALAWELAEWQTAAFGFFEAGCPERRSDVRLAFGGYHVEAPQDSAFRQLVADNLRLFRPHSGIRSLEGGRGLATLDTMLTTFEERWRAPDRVARDLGKLAGSAALAVDPERIAICSPAGEVWPEQWLRGERRREFLDVESRLLPEVECGPVPPSCFMVTEAVEGRLREVLLAAGMAILVAEEDVPRLPSGRPLLGGLFCVPHTDKVDRLIFDRRPANSREKRLGWAQLPLGCQFSRLLLRRKEGVRGSGDDLRTYFYRLRCAPGGHLRNCFGRQVPGDSVRQWVCVSLDAPTA
jgi:hypothetical protein